MGQPGKKTPSRGEQFGDPRLANLEIVPVGADQRILDLRRVAPLWAAMGLAPAFYVAATGALSVPVALAVVGVATLFTAGGAAMVAISSGRYGVGFVPLCRAAFGGRGAWLPLVVRWLVGVGWLATGALVFGQWVVSLVLATGALPSNWHSPEVMRGGAWLVSAVLLAGGYWVSRRGMSRLIWVAPVSVALVSLGGFALVVWAGIASRGFGDWFQRPLVPGVDAELALAASLLGVGCLVVLSGPDWERFRVPFGRANRRRGLVALAVGPLMMVPVAVAFAFFGALLAAASSVVRGRFDGHLIPDAAGFGGLLAGGAATLLAIVAWSAPAGLLGFYSGALALCGLPARRLSYHRGLGLTWLGAVVWVAATLVDDLGPLLRGAGLLGAALAGVLLVDALALRRTKVVLEDLYLFTPGYGPVAGVTLSAVIALAAGLLFEPHLLARWPAALQPWPVVLSPNLSLPAALAAGAAVFVVLAPVERGLARLFSRWLERRAVRPKPARLSDSSVTEGLTNPHYVAGGQSNADEALFRLDGGDEKPPPTT